jgi:hypothetical protein
MSSRKIISMIDIKTKIHDMDKKQKSKWTIRITVVIIILIAIFLVSCKGCTSLASTAKTDASPTASASAIPSAISSASSTAQASVSPEPTNTTDVISESQEQDPTVADSEQAADNIDKTEQQSSSPNENSSVPAQSDPHPAPACTLVHHDAVTHTETKHHDAITHLETVVDTPAQDKTICVCSECGQKFDSEAEWEKHSAYYWRNGDKNHSSWYIDYEKVPAVTHQETVVDQAAYDETITVVDSPAYDENVCQ